MSTLELLVGRTIKGISISTRRDYLVFQTDEGMLVYRTDGDCCSQSWVADLLGVRSVLGRPVTATADIFTDCPAPEDGRSSPDEQGNPSGSRDTETMYGLQIDCAPMGQLVIIFRNSSNGYYGGWMECTGDALPDEVFRAVTEDLSA